MNQLDSDDMKAKIRTRNQIEAAKQALATMEVKPLPLAMQCDYTHVGTMWLDGKIIRYYGKMINGCFVFDPLARDVI